MFLSDLENKLKDKSLKQLNNLLNTRKNRLEKLYDKRLNRGKIWRMKWGSAWALNRDLWHISFDINKTKDEIELIEKYIWLV